MEIDKNSQAYKTGYDYGIKIASAIQKNDDALRREYQNKSNKERERYVKDGKEMVGASYFDSGRNDGRNSGVYNIGYEAGFKIGLEYQTTNRIDAEKASEIIKNNIDSIDLFHNFI